MFTFDLKQHFGKVENCDAIDSHTRALSHYLHTIREFPYTINTSKTI
jgi:hypothetical protein